MRSPVRWGVALTAIGVVIAVIAILTLPFLLIFGVPLIVLGLALIIWQGREEKIEAMQE